MGSHARFCISWAFFLWVNTVFSAVPGDETFTLFPLVLFHEFLKMLLSF